MKKEENKKQVELKDEQLDNVAGAGRREDVIRKYLTVPKDDSGAANDAAKG